jgi:hypothetical protein
VEARIRVSGTQGLWPAFWLLGEDLSTGRASWPECGEIDVMEHVGRAPDEISSTLHAAAYRLCPGLPLTVSGCHLFVLKRPSGDSVGRFSPDMIKATQSIGSRLY